MNVPHPTTAQWITPIDPVCGRPIEPVPVAHNAWHADRDYYFCSARCLEKFRTDPARFTSHAPGN